LKNKLPTINKKIAGGNRIIYLQVTIKNVTRNSRQHTNRVLPVYEQGMPRYNLAKIGSIQQRINMVWDVVNWLDVENSRRYRPDGKTTYCNI